MQIDALYHWSPRDRKKQILRHGLRPNMRPTIGTVRTVSIPWNDDEPVPMICLGTDPLIAWRLSGDMKWARALNVSWDLWQVKIAEGDGVHYLSNYGPTLYEVRVSNRIPKNRVTWLAER